MSEAIEEPAVLSPLRLSLSRLILGVTFACVAAAALRLSDAPELRTAVFLLLNAGVLVLASRWLFHAHAHATLALLLACFWFLLQLLAAAVLFHEVSQSGAIYVGDTGIDPPRVSPVVAKLWGIGHIPAPVAGDSWISWPPPKWLLVYIGCVWYFWPAVALIHGALLLIRLLQRKVEVRGAARVVAWFLLALLAVGLVYHRFLWRHEFEAWLG